MGKEEGYNRILDEDRPKREGGSRGGRGTRGARQGARKYEKTEETKTDEVA